jgi:hypothetical protein
VLPASALPIALLPRSHVVRSDMRMPLLFAAMSNDECVNKNIIKQLIAAGAEVNDFVRRVLCFQSIAAALLEWKNFEFH